jgi:hypothetical protein
MSTAYYSGRYVPPAPIDLGTFRIKLGNEVDEFAAVPFGSTRSELAATVRAEPGVVVVVRGAHRSEVVEEVAAGDVLSFDRVDDVRAAVLDAVQRARLDESADYTPDVAYVYSDAIDDDLVLASRLLRAMYEARR